MAKNNLEESVKKGKETKYTLKEDGYPPAVSICEDGEIKITWNFLYDYRIGEYYAEGTGIGGFYKCGRLSEDKNKAIQMYKRLFAQEWDPETNTVKNAKKETYEDRWRCSGDVWVVQVKDQRKK